jgi:hypothetical protein
MMMRTTTQRTGAAGSSAASAGLGATCRLGGVAALVVE